MCKIFSRRKVALIDPETSSNAEIFEAITVRTEGLGLTQIFDKLALAERELLRERGRRQEAEAYLQQVLKDVEKKAPIIASQRRDYMR